MRNYREIFLLLFIILSSCSEICDCEVSSEVMNKNDRLLKIMDENGRLKDIHSCYGVPEVFDSEECIQLFITNGHGKCEIYRLTKTGSSYTFFNKVTENNGSKLSVLYSSGTKKINSNVFFKIKELIESSCFWTAPIESKENTPILDGEMRYLEVFRLKENPCTFKQYHIVARNSLELSVFKDVYREIISYPLRSHFPSTLREHNGAICPKK